MNKFREGYLSLDNDEAKRGYLDAAMSSIRGSSDGVFVGLMQEILGDDWVEELERLGYAERIGR